MKEKSSADKQIKEAAKKEIRTDCQRGNKIISEEELKKKGGMTGDKTHLFIGFLRIYNNGGMHNKYGNTMIGLAKFIFHKRLLYIKSGNEYKLMKLSSIIDYLHHLNKTVVKDMEQELKEKENNKSRRY